MMEVRDMEELRRTGNPPILLCVNVGAKSFSGERPRLY